MAMALDPTIDRPSERMWPGQRAGWPENMAQLHHLVSGRRVFVYMDNTLITRGEDTKQPELGGGLIMLQTNNSIKPVRLDDIVIQKPEPGTETLKRACCRPLDDGHGRRLHWG